MRGKRFLLFAVVPATAGLVAWILPSPGSGGPLPSYQRFTDGGSLRPFRGLNYDIFAVNAFRGGPMWINTLITSNSGACYHLDIATRAVIGELTGALPIYEPQPGRLLFCRTWSVRRAWNEKFAKFVHQITLGNLCLRTTSGYVEKFWLLDLERNSAVSVGEVEEPVGLASGWTPSPAGRKAFSISIPSFMDGRSEVRMLDADATALRPLSVDGSPVGWWSENELLVKKGMAFTLFDVTTQHTMDLLSADDVLEFFRREKIDVVGKFLVSPVWNGTEYDFYLKNTRSLEDGESYIATIVKRRPALSLIAENFKFERLGRFDPAAKFYVFPGDTKRENRNAVYVREIQTGRTREVVPPNGSGRFSMPSFDGSDIVFQQTNSIWRISLTNVDASPIRLFPPGNR